MLGDGIDRLGQPVMPDCGGWTVHRALPRQEVLTKPRHQAKKALRMIPTLPGVTTVAQTIALSLAPVFLLAGIGQLLNVLAGRLSRVVDRTRALEVLHPRSSGPEHDRHVWELRLLDRRISIINHALFLAVSSAIMTCIVIACLFIATLAKLHLATIVALSFILAMILLVAALVSFMIEVRVSLRAIHVRQELLK